MPIKLWLRANESNEITTWGYEPLVASTEASAPDDFYTYGPAKYLWDGSKFVVRSGWSDPLPESEIPEVPAEPETPADPE